MTSEDGPVLDYSSQTDYQGPGSFLGLRSTRRIRQVDVAIVGIPFDTGGAPGSRYAPQAIRAASVGVRSTNSSQRVNILRLCQAIDYGDISVIPGVIEDTYQEITEGLRPLLEANVVPICMGGDHSVTLGELRAMHRRYGGIAWVQLDAHADAYESYFDGKVRYNAGTFVRRAVEENLIDPARSTLIGVRSFRDVDDDARDLGFEVLTMDEIVASPPIALAEHVRARIGGQPAFLSFDIDAIDPACAPATGTQVPGGLTSREALAIVRSLCDISFVGFDVVEVNPLLEGSRTTATLAANLIFEFMSLIALQKSS